MLIRSQCCQTKYENRLGAGGRTRGTAVPTLPMTALEQEQHSVVLKETHLLSYTLLWDPGRC